MANTTGKKFGGRVKGTPNKQTADIKALAQSHGPEAIQALIDILHSCENPSARISAAKELLDRGFGRAIQAVEVTGAEGSPLNFVVNFLKNGEKQE